MLVQQIEGHVLYPFLMSRSVHLHPAVVVIALGIGAVLGGIVGVFLAVPVAGVIAVLLDYAREHADDDDGRRRRRGRARPAGERPQRSGRIRRAPPRRPPAAEARRGTAARVRGCRL